MKLSKLIERFAIRTGWLATPEESEYLSWADTRLDELSAIAKTGERRAAAGDRRLDSRTVINHVHSFERCDQDTCRLPLWVRVPVREGGRRHTDGRDQHG